MINGLKLLGSVRGIDLNTAAPADLTTIKINSARYVVTHVVIYNPSASAPLATLGFYSAAAGGGEEVVAPVALADITGTGKVQSLTVEVITSLLTGGSLYPRLTVAAGGAATADVAVFGLELP